MACSRCIGSVAGSIPAWPLFVEVLRLMFSDHHSMAYIASSRWSNRVSRRTQRGRLTSTPSGAGRFYGIFTARTERKGPCWATPRYPSALHRTPYAGQNRFVQSVSGDGARILHLCVATSVIGFAIATQINFLSPLWGLPYRGMG